MTVSVLYRKRSNVEGSRKRGGLRETNDETTRGVTTSREMLEAAGVRESKTEKEKESDYSMARILHRPARLEINSGRSVILKRCIILGSEMERLGQRP